MADDVLTAQEAAEALGYHINHLYRLLAYDVIKGRQFNGVWMIARSEVERIKALQGPDGKLPDGTLPHR